MQLVTRGQFRSRDKDAMVTPFDPPYIAEKPMHAAGKLHGSMFHIPELLLIEILHCMNSLGIFLPFLPCDLDLEPMNFIYELDAYSLEV